MAEQQHTTMVWKGGMAFEGTTTTGHKLIVDASREGGGQDSGPKPIELVLSALAGCTAMDVLSILQKKREPMKGLEVYVEGERASEHPMVYKHATIVYRVYGEVSKASVERAIELSNTKYCGVHAMLGKTAHIDTRYEILPARNLEAIPAA